MAREKKTDLLDEAQERGLNVEEDDHYDDVLAAVKAARAVEEEPEEPEEVEVEPEEVEDDPEPPQRGWSRLGVWHGPGRPA